MCTLLLLVVTGRPYTVPILIPEGPRAACDGGLVCVKRAFGDAGSQASPFRLASRAD